MRSMKRLTLMAVATSTFACATDPGSVTEEGLSPIARSSAALTADNGTNLNGTNLNGTNLNGTNLNGTNLNGGTLNHTLLFVRFAGATKEGDTGRKFEWVELRGTELFGYRGSALHRGIDFNDAHFYGALGDGREVKLWLRDAQPGAGGDAGVWTYDVVYWDEPRQAWYPICINNQRQAVRATAVNGRWDHTQGTPTGGSKVDDPATFTFACEGGAITKCIRMGYKPWATGALGTGLAAHHQACTRVIRADYCGDGTSYTVDGQWVNVYDGLGIQRDTESWYFEAEWDAAGARCFSPHNRYHAHVPCYLSKTQSGCGQGSTFTLGTLLMTETPYRN